MKEFYSMLTPEQQKKSADLYDLLITQPSMGVRMGRMLGEMGNGPTE
jgi:hypothetical protein